MGSTGLKLGFRPSIYQGVSHLLYQKDTYGATFRMRFVPFDQKDA